MSKYSQTIEYNLKTSLDSSGITKLQQELTKTARVLRSMSDKQLISTKDVNSSLANIEKLNKALTKAFNPTTGMLNTQELTKSLQGLNLKQLQDDFFKLGVTGKTSFNNIVGELGKVNISAVKTSKSLDKIFNSFTNTVRWGVVSSGFNSMRNSIQQSVEYMKDLDDSLTQIMMVTDYSRENMNQYARDANRIAKELGSTTVAMTNASLVFAQQGFNLNESQHLAELSTKVAVASQQTTAQASDQITAYMNAYGLDNDMEALDAAMDSWALVANVSAADVGELAAASQKAASAAATVGVSMDQLNGQIAAIESVTREAPEQIGNGLKTLYARLSDIQMGETLDDGVDLGKVTTTLENIGVQVLDGGGQMRNVGDIMEDLMDVWSTLNQTEKAAVAQTLAGKHQLARFEALMNRSDLYEEYKTASENADGTLDEMNAKYVDSLEGHLNQLQNAWEGVALSFADTDSFYGVIEVLTTLVEVFGTFIDSIGGGGQALLGFGAIATRVFSKQLAQNFTRIQFNRNAAKDEKESKKNTLSDLQQLGLTDIDTGDQHVNDIVDFSVSLQKNQNVLSPDQIKEYNKLIQESIEIVNNKVEAEEEQRQAIEATNWAYQVLTGNLEENVVTIDPKTNQIDTSKLQEYQDNQSDQFDSQSLGILSDSAQQSVEYTRGLSIQLQNIDTLMTNIQNHTDFDLDSQTEDAILLNDALDDIEHQFELLQNQASNGVMTSVVKNGFEDDEYERYQSIITKNQDKIIKLKEQTENINDKLNKAFLKGDKEGIQEYSKEISELQQQIDDFTTDIVFLNEMFEQVRDNASSVVSTKSGMDALNEKVSNAQQRADVNSKGVQQAQQDVGLTAEFENAIQSIGAFTELSSAVMTLSNLGTIFADDSLSNFEKLGQLVTNLTYSLPSVISALLQISQLDFKNLQKLGTFLIEPITTAIHKFKALNSTMIASGNGALGFAAKMKVVKASLTSTQMAVIGLELAMTLLTAGMMAYNYMAEKARQKDQALADSIAETSSAIQETSSSIQTWSQIFNEYQNGAATTEDLVNAHRNLNNVTETTAMKIAANNGQWELYNQLLEENLKLEAEKQRIQADQNYDAAVENAEATTGFGNKGDLKAATSIDYRPLENYGAEHLQSDGHGGYIFSPDATADDILTELPAAIEGITEEIKSTQEKLNDPSLTDEQRKSYERTLEWQQEKLKGLTDLRDTDAYQELEQGAKAKADAAVSTVLTSPEYSDLLELQDGESMEEYKQRVMDSGLGISEGMIDAFVEGMISANPDSDLAYAAAQEDFDQQLAQNYENKGWTATKTDENGNTVEISGEEFAQGVRSKLDSTNLSNEELFKLETSIDEDTLIEHLDEIIARINSGESVDDIILEYGLKPTANTTQEFDFDNESDRQAYASKNTNLSGEEFDSYIDNYGERAVDDKTEKHNIEIYQQREEEKYDKLVNERDALKKDPQARKDVDYDDQMKKLNKEIDDQKKKVENTDAAWEQNNKQMQKVAAANARAQKGMDALSKSLDENAKILKEGDTASTQYSNAMLETKESVADLLGVDMSNLSDDFVLDNLENLQGVVDGDQEALDRLRENASQEIIQKIAVDVPEAEEPLKGLINDLNAQDLGINMTADLDDSDYVEKLNKMMEDGTLTADQVSQVLSSAGYEGEFEPVEGKPVTPDPIVYDVTREVSATGEKPQTIVETVTMEQKPYTPKMSVLKGATQKGGIGSGISKPSNTGKGGGGGGKSKKPKKTKPLDEKHDRYEKINTQLGKTSKELEKIADEEDRLVGPDKLNNLEKQCDILRKQITLQKEKLKIQKQEAAELKKSLSQDYGVRYDAEGVITNYKDIFYKLQNEVNAAQKKADKDSENEAAQDALDKAKDRFEKFKEDHGRYNELISDEIAGTENEIAGLQDQIEDLRIDIFNTSIDAAESLKDLRQSFIELQDVLSQSLEEDPFKDYKTSIKQLNLLIQDTNKNVGKIEYGADNILSRDYTNLVDILREIETMEKTGRSDIFGENAAEMWETAHNIYETAQGDIEEYSDAIQDLYGNIQDMIDSISEMYDRQNEKYESMSNELEHYSDIITMLHGENAYAELEAVYAAQNHVYESQIEFQKNQLAQLRHEQSLFDPEKQKEAWQNLEDQIRDTENSISDLVSSSLTNLRTMYENSVSNILDSWTKGAMGDDLDWLSTEWELLNRNADYYLDDVNKAFNIQQLQSKYLDMMDANNDILLQQKISKQMEQQLGYLREKTKLSEYDVKYANAQLDILQKQIALEEAQQNKSQLKLRRDSQGNYSYAYAANENNIREAQRALDEANNNAYNMSKEQMKKTQEDAFAALSDARNQLEEIWNSTLSDEEKKKRSQTVIDSLKEYLTNTEKELTTAQKNILNDFIDATTNINDENKGNLNNILQEVLAGNEGAFDLIDTRFDTSRTEWMHNMDAFLSKSDEAYNQLIVASQRYQEQIKQLGDQTGTDFSNMNDLIQGTVNRTDALNKSSKELDATIQQMNIDLEKAVGSLNQFLAIFEKLSEAEFIQKLDNLLQALVDKEKQDAELANKMSGRTNKPTNVKDGIKEQSLEAKNAPTPGTDSSNFALDRTPSTLSIGSIVRLKPGAVCHEEPSGEGNQISLTDAGLIGQINRNGAYPIFLTTQSGLPGGWVRKEDLEGFRTGGYTGSWGKDDGKIALLHQKELILNEQDTQNILKAVSLVREFAENFKSQMFTNPLEQWGRAITPMNPHTDIDQQIHITAEFPSAESASEIKEALLSLSDMAIQHTFTY